MMLSDEKLFELVVREDDQNAFEELVVKYRFSAVNYVTKIIRDHYYAQDLTQNVFANIYFKRKQIGVPSSFKFYLYKALKNQSIDWIRKNRRIKEVNIDMFTFSFEQAEVDDSIQNLKHLLKEEDYQLIILRFYYGFKFKEIAEIMNITAGNARIRCSRLKWKLRGLKNEEK